MLKNFADRLEAAWAMAWQGSDGRQGYGLLKSMIFVIADLVL
jgi:hypothetical protein